MLQKYRTNQDIYENIVNNFIGFFFVVVAFIVIFLRNTTVVYAGDLQLRFNKTKKC